jgi:aryl-alcohol dehydrogenase-like predicted oxidoreductase
MSTRAAHRTKRRRLNSFAALDLGINFLDTANIYGDSELKIGKAVQDRQDGVVLATKFGIVTDSPVQNRGLDGTPENARGLCDLSLKRLGVDRIDLYYLHRVDHRSRSKRPSARWQNWFAPERSAI